MGQGFRGSFRRMTRRMSRRMSRRTPRRMIRRTPRRMTRRPVPRTGSRRRAPARQASVTRPPLPAGRARQVVPFRRARRPVPRTGSHRRAPARQAPVTRPPLPAGRARQVVPGDRSRGPGAAAAPLRGKPPSRARPFRRVAPGARRAPRPFRDAACPPRVQIKNIETASIRVSCDLRPLETLAFCAAAQDLGRCPKPRQGAKGSVSPVGCCTQRKATRSAPEGSVSPVGCWANGPKRPAGVSKYKGCARQRTERRYLRGQRNHECAGGKRQPCGLLRVAQSDPQA